MSDLREKVMKEDQELLAHARTLGEKAESEDTPTKERLLALMELGMRAEQVRGALLRQSLMVGTPNEETSTSKPEYRWVRGAKVKVK